MPVTRLADAAAYFTRAFNAGDRAALLAYYAPDAKLVLGPGQEHAGHAAIARAMENFLATRGTMRIDPVYAVEHGDTALLRGTWRLDGTGPDGAPLVMTGSNVEVLRRQADGTWACVIDHPFGAT